LQAWINNFRQVVPLIQEDRLLHNDMASAEKFLKEAKLEW
jgi:histidine ammonia-lyase